MKHGLLHKKMNVKSGKHIAESSLEREKAAAKRKGDVTLEREVQFAINTRKWHHGK